MEKELKLSHSTISTIWKNREALKSSLNENRVKVKRHRKSTKSAIDDALFKWFKAQRSLNVPISGPILQEKANKLAKDLGMDVVCTSSWIQRFRYRHQIVFGKLCGESAAAPEGVSENWLANVWPILKADYDPEDIFNADETGLFFNMTPDRSLKFKGEKCSNGKMSKERLTIMVATNMTGTCKKKLLIIGKSKKPRCFKNVSSLPVEYDFNKKAWMTSVLFHSWLRTWDSELKKKNRRILLIVDNCPSHTTPQDLKFIKLVFFPPNVTSILQPCDQGIIKSLKTHYRKLHVSQIIQRIENNQPTKLSVLDAILLASKAWDNVTSSTIKNCFRHAGFQIDSENFDSDDSLEDDEDNIPLALRFPSSTENSKISLDEAFIDVDQDLFTCEQYVDAELIQTETEESISDSEEEIIESPTIAEACGAMSLLQKFIACNDNFFGEQTNNALLSLEKN